MFAHAHTRSSHVTAAASIQYTLVLATRCHQTLILPSARTPLQDEAFKNSFKQVKVHTRVALDDVLREAYPHMTQGNDASRILVTMNNVKLVRGTHTTLEELRVPHQAELKIEPISVPPATPAFGSIGDTIAAEPLFYNVLFSLMEEGDSAIPTLVWDVLMSLPTSLQETRKVQVRCALWPCLCRLVVCGIFTWMSKSARQAQMSLGLFLCDQIHLTSPKAFPGPEQERACMYSCMRNHPVFPEVLVRSCIFDVSNMRRSRCF
jgi:hypothetical protein